MTDQQPPPTDEELDEFEELGRWYDPRTSMTEQWADDLGSAVVRLVAEVRRLRKVVESARPASVVTDASPPERSPSASGREQAWGRAVARAAAWFVIVAVVIALVVAFPTLLAVIVVGGLLWWAIAVLVRTSKTRGDGKA